MCSRRTGRPDHRGCRAAGPRGHEGLIWVDGNPYCGAMPAKLISDEVFYKRLFERRRYLAKPNASGAIGGAGSLTVSGG